MLVFDTYSQAKLFINFGDSLNYKYITLVLDFFYPKSKVFSFCLFYYGQVVWAQFLRYLPKMWSPYLNDK